MEKCRNGHPAEQFRFYRRNGAADCLKCQYASSQRYYQRRMAGIPPEPRGTETHCKRGHPWAEFGVLAGKQQARRCRLCHRERVRVQHQARYHSDPEYRAKVLAQSRDRYARRPKPEKPPKPPRTHCAKGHPWTPDNVYVLTKTGQAFCKTCHRARARDYARRRYWALRAERKSA